MPPACGGLLFALLRLLAADDVRSAPEYLLMYTLMGGAWLGVIAMSSKFLGIHHRDDAVERRNGAAAVALSGSMQSALAVDPADEVDDPPNEFISPTQPLAAGEVMAVNRDAGTITIRHKPIPDIFLMETMTMIFRVSDKSMLEGLTAGDKIRFKVERDGRSFVVTRIENTN